MQKGYINYVSETYVGDIFDFTEHNYEHVVANHHLLCQKFYPVCRVAKFLIILEACGYLQERAISLSQRKVYSTATERGPLSALYPGM